MAKTYKDALIEFFITNSGLSISEAKQKIITKIKLDFYDADIIIHNVRLFYTNNSNYSGGASNGYGAGFYIYKTGLSGNRTFKL